MICGKKFVNVLLLMIALAAVPAYFASAALTGQQVYDQYCAGCHRLGAYDSSGSPDLLGKGSGVSNKYKAGVSGHKGVTLSASDIANVAAFLDNPTPAPAPVSITTSSLANGAVGTSYSQTLAATGGTPPYTWSYSGNLPPGIGLTSSGSFTGTPTTAGAFSFTARVTDSKSASATQALSLTITAAGRTTMTTADKDLFINNCLNCHSPTGVQNATPDQIQAAINGNVGDMGTPQLKSLTSADLGNIADALSPTPLPSWNCSACHNSSGTGSTGQQIYDQNCAGCHRMGSYDTSGSAPDLSGSTRIDSYYTAGASGHKGITLNATDINNLKTFVGASTSTPTTGQAVYDKNCAGCHRMGSYDTSGSAPNLSGSTRIDRYYKAGVAGHKRITLSATDISNLKTFVKSADNGGGDDDGEGEGDDEGDD